MPMRWWRHATGTVRASRILRPGPRTRGQALVELAIILPVLLLLLLAALDLGRIYYARIAVENAAREAAYEAATDPYPYDSSACSAGNPIMCAATREAQAGSWVVVTPADVTWSCSGGCTKTYGNRVTATVTGHFSLMTPIMWAFTGGPDVTFASVAVADHRGAPAPDGARSDAITHPDTQPDPDAGSERDPGPDGHADGHPVPDARLRAPGGELHLQPAEQEQAGRVHERLDADQR